ncbi:MAG: helix-turn-helix transcriptional regulator [Saprospiraceae bacterium]
MKHQNLKIDTITQQRFYQLWEETRSDVTDDENQIYQFFKPYIESIPKLVLGEYYWQIFLNTQPIPKILMAEGSVKKMTSMTDNELISVPPEIFFSRFKEEDLLSFMTYLAIIFPKIFSLAPDQREKFNFTIYARVMNDDNKYKWNSIQYPALYFDENDQFLYGMVLYTNVDHLMKPDAISIMTVLDATVPDKQLFTYYSSKDQQWIEKPYPKTSQREKEIISLLSQGKASKQIADILGITKNTVDNHRQRLLKKFGVQSSAELVIKAMNL